ncbi:MAG: hydrogenase maturation protease [Candidatus Omnitrophica bacterium]|nr:hydrogenase maturation protease [Candidatus Omnitrophota bacterium]
MPKKIAIIGIGSTLRRDDGIGIMVLESLLKFYKRKDIDYFNFGNASFDLLHKIKTYDAILLIDGINAGLGVGELKISELKDIEYKLDNSVTSTHELNLKSIFELAKKLGIKTRIYLAGIQVGEISFKEGLSEALRYRKEDIVKEIATFIDKIF